LLEQIKIAANKRDVPYQSLIKMWLAEKVEQSNQSDVIVSALVLHGMRDSGNPALSLHLVLF
jgi:hypothetical protein